MTLQDDPGDLPPSAEDDARSVLAREIPRRQALIRPVRYNFEADGFDKKLGPLGVATPDDTGRPSPIAPARQMGSFQVASNQTASFTNIYVLSIKRPTIVQVLQWNYGTVVASGRHLMYFRAVTPALSTTALPFQVGLGGMAYLNAPGDWYLAFFTDTAGIVWCSTMEVDNQEAEVFVSSSVREQAQVHQVATDVVLGVATPAVIFTHLFGVVVAVNVKNVGPNPARVQLGAGAINGSGGIHLNSINNYGSEFTFQGPTLMSGDIWATSPLSTTLAVNVFYRLN